jgi:hypothetical protein
MPHKEHNQETTGQTGRQADDVDQREGFAAQKIPVGDFEVVGKHIFLKVVAL